MDFETFSMFWKVCMCICLLMTVYGIFFNKSGRPTYSDEEWAEIERYYNEHGTVPKWVITGNSPYRRGC